MKAILAALILLSSLWLILYGILLNQETKIISATAIHRLHVWKIIQSRRKAGKGARPATKNVTDRAIKHVDVWKIIEAERQYLQRNPNVNYYVSKRRVPTGPNAIHNRKVGEYRKPPTRT
ncbi:unnamed protein product [Withania somnifera]